MYYAALDALTKIVVDRPKFPVAVASLSKLHISTELVTEAQKVRVDDHASFSEERKHKGIVQSVKKTAKGVELSFVKEKHQETVFDCAPTGQIISWQPNGAPNYYQVCKDPTLRTVDDTADGITIPTEWAAGIAPGAAVEFKVEIAAAPDRLAIPTAVYKDKARKALVNWFGFGL